LLACRYWTANLLCNCLLRNSGTQELRN
jgi:hypothetical protein